MQDLAGLDAGNQQCREENKCIGFHLSKYGAYVQTYIHTYVRTYTHAYIHTYIHT